MAEETDVTQEVTQPKQTKKKEPVKVVQAKPMVYIDTFFEATRPIFGLTGLQRAGFKAYMAGNHYLPDLNDFIPYLDKYLGKQ